MATLSGILDRVRLELADLPQSFATSIIADGVSTRFEMEIYPVDGTSLTIKVDGVTMTTGVSVEERTGVLWFDAAPDPAAEITVTGTKYRYFTNTDLTSIVEAASSQHIYSRNDAFGRGMTLSNLPPVEEYPLALLATVEALYTLATDAAFDIDIMAPDGVNIPRSERYRQLMDMIATRREQYETLCSALNIGLNRIEVYTLRRVSRMTNKYIPVYQPQEIDDQSRPKRVYLPIPTYGGIPIPEDASIYDIVVTQGDTFSMVLDFPFDLTTYTPKAQIRLFPEAQTVWSEFTITPVTGSPDKIELSLTSMQTSRLPLQSVWDMQLTTADTPPQVTTFLKGSVFSPRQVTKVAGVDSNMNDLTPNPPWLSGTAQSGFEPTNPPGSP